MFLFKAATMANRHLLSLTQEKYELFISNLQIEDALTDSDPSSASSFTMDVNLDLEPLLFLRSATAKLGLSYLTIDNLALAFTRDEALSFLFSTPPELLLSNLVFNPGGITTTNDKEFFLKFTDYTAPDPEAPLNYVNRMLESFINPFLSYRLSLHFFDKNLFATNLFSNVSLQTPITFNKDEINILLRYVDIFAFIRQVLAELLADPKKPTFTFSNVKPVLSLELEQSVLSSSKILKSLAERNIEESIFPFHLAKLESFYNVNLSNNNPKKKDLQIKIKTDLLEIFETILDISINSPSPSDQIIIEGMKSANAAMMSQGELLQRILLVERSKLDGTIPQSLFNTEYLSLSMDESGSKVEFNINNQKFLPPDQSSLSVSFPPKAAYTLGCSPTEIGIKVGPISHSSDCTSIRAPYFTNTILSKTQRLFCAIRHHPKLIRVLTNVLSASENRNLWPVSDDFANFQTFFCLAIDDATLKERFIHKTSSDLDFHRMLPSETVLRAFSLLFLDENGKIVSFPRNTYVFASIRLQPLSND